MVAYDLDPHNPRSVLTTLVVQIQDVQDNQPRCPGNLKIATTTTSVAVGTPLTQLTCNDDDTGPAGQITYTLDETNAASTFSMFQIDSVTGSLVLKSGITDHTVPYYEILIKVQDGGTPALFTNVLVRLVVSDVPQDIPQPPSRFNMDLAHISGSMSHPLDTRNSTPLPPPAALGMPYCSRYAVTAILPESIPEDTMVYDLGCEDPDGDHLTYAILRGNVYDKFKIENNGQLVLNKELNADGRDRYYLRITARDNSYSAFISTVTVAVTVTNVNDNHPVINDLPSTIKVGERQPIGALAHKCTITDKDSPEVLGGQTRVGWPNSDGVYKNWLVDSTTCNLYVNTQLDFETTSMYVLTLLAWDLDPIQPLTTTATFTILIDDENDAPVCDVSKRVSVSEGASISSEITTVHCSDVDTGLNGQLTYSLDGDTAALSKFEVRPESGEINLIGGLDYSQQTSYQVKLIASDGGVPSRTSSTNVQIDVISQTVINTSPICPAIGVVTVPEDSPIGSTVTSITCTDSDPGVSGQVFYRMAGSNVPITWNSFQVVESTGELKIKTTLDYQQSSHNVRILVFDGGAPTLSVTATVTVNVLEVYEAPVCNESISIRIPETTALNSPFYTMSCTDSDSGLNGVVHYQIHGANTDVVLSKFEVDISTGEVSLKAQLDFEQRISYEVIIIAYDGGSPSLSSTATLTVNVGPVNEVPVCQASESVSLPEASPVGTPVWTLTCTDSDTGANGQISYRLDNNNTADVAATFEVGASSGRVKLRDVLDYSQHQSYDVQVVAYDGGSPSQSFTSTIIVSVLKTNEAPVCTGNPVVSLPESSTTGSSVRNLMCTDADSGTNGLVYYKLDESNTATVIATFQIGMTTGQVTLKTGLDYEQHASHQVKIIAYDGASPSLSFTSTVTVIVIDNNEPPACPGSPSANVLENSATGTNVASITCNDLDAGTNGQIDFKMDESNSVTTKNLFQVNSTGQVSLKAGLNFEQQISHVVKVVAYDGGSPSLSATATLSVNVLDNNESPVCPASESVSLPEDSPTGTPVGTITCTDPDAGVNGQITYTLDGSTSDLSKFQIGSNTVTLAAGLNYDQQSSHQLTVIASDGGNPSLSSTTTLTITVLNVNRPPVCPSSSLTANMGETSPIGSGVKTLSCTDIDTGTDGQLSYKLDDTNSAATKSIFEVNPTSGQVSLTSGLDFDQQSSHQVKVIAYDGGSPSLSFTSTIMVNVADDNEHPVCDVSQSISLSENRGVGTGVTTVTCTDADTGVKGQVFFKIGESNSDVVKTIFEVNPTTGQVSLKSGLNYEQQTSYQVQVVAYDGGSPSLSFTSTIQVTVTDINEAPSCPVNPAVSVRDDTPVGRTIETLSCSDDDAGVNGVVSYKMEGSNIVATLSTFEVGLTTGQLRLKSGLNYDQHSSYEVRIIAYDGGSPSLSFTTTISVTVSRIQNSAPVCPASQTVNIGENSSPGIEVATITCTDTDVGTAGQVYFRIDDTNTPVVKTSFRVDYTNGLVTLLSPLDYEQYQSHEVKVIATDGGSPSLSSTATIVVNVMNDNDAPVCPASESVSLPEDSPAGTLVGTITCTDTDTGVDGQITFKIDGSNTATVLSIYKVASTTGQVSLKAVLDYDPQTVHQVLVIATDGGSPNLSSTATLTVTVLEVNESPVCPLSQSVSVQEDSQTGIPVGTITCTDTDTGVNGQISYKIDGSNTATVLSIYEVASTTGQVSLKAVLDYDPQTVHQVLVIATDGGSPNLSSTATLTVTVVDVNESPVCPSSRSITLGESTPTSNTVTTIDCTDPDIGVNADIYFKIDESNLVTTKNIFQVDSTTGQVSLKTGLDYEQQPSHVVKVIAYDGGSPSLSFTTTIMVTVVTDNKFPVCPASESVSLPEDSPTGTPVGTITCTDSDAGVNGQISYTLDESNSVTTKNLFQVSSTGQVSLAAGLNYDQQQTHQVKVIASDGGSPSLSSTATIIVNVLISTNINHAPVCSGDYDSSVSEGSIIGTVITTITCTDIDTGVNGQISYLIDGTNSATIKNLFQVTATGEVSLKAILNYDQQKSHQVRIIATDGGSPSLTSTATLTVNIQFSRDVNHAPVCPASRKTNVTDTATVGKILTQLVCTDVDEGVNGAVSYTLDGANSEEVKKNFIVSRSTGRLTLNSELDANKNNLFTIRVIVVDGGSPSLSVTATIFVNVTAAASTLSTAFIGYLFSLLIWYLAF
ncbi:protocadherin Fat 4 [Patella vulgata]|uniref:protocadherin Fat 4 n=1 Tax=Patella vulgata TaxID=6465 RepID=UPI0024A834B1|nr:protocadherin Fat 4 [Patella vulgata]